MVWLIQVVVCCTEFRVSVSTDTMQDWCSRGQLRKVEHGQYIMGYKLRSEASYFFMFKHGQAASWWFLTVVCAEHGVVVPLDQLEQKENTRVLI